MCVFFLSGATLLGAVFEKGKKLMGISPKAVDFG